MFIFICHTKNKLRCDEMDPITYTDCQINRRKPMMTLVEVLFPKLISENSFFVVRPLILDRGYNNT